MVECPFCKQEFPSFIEQVTGTRLAACTKCLNPSVIEWSGQGVKVSSVKTFEPVDVMAAKGSVMAGVFELLGKAIAELPALPEVPQRIASMINDPIIAIAEIAEVAGRDAAVSMKIMQMANSALYSTPRAITDLPTACSRLGLKVLGQVVQSVAAANMYVVKSKTFSDIMARLWRHAIATAHCADELSVHAPELGRTIPFSMGLVHDIGKLVLIELITVRYKGNTGRLRESPKLLLRVIERFHPLVGLHVVQHWRMTPEHAHSTFFGTYPNDAPIETWRPPAHIVSLASDLADACGFAISEEVDPNILEGHPSADALGISQEELNALRDKLADPIEAFMESLG